MIALDLTRYKFRRTVGDLAIFGTWVTTEDELGVAKTEPAIVLVPLFHKGSPCAVCLSAAFQYDEQDYLKAAAVRFAEGMGYAVEPGIVFRIMTAIHDHLQDLIEMPPNPVEQIIVGEGTVYEGDQKRTFNVMDKINRKFDD